MSGQGRKPVQGRPPYLKTQAVDEKGRQLCIWWSLGRCEKMGEEWCLRAGRRMWHRCSTIVSLEPMKLCLGGHEPGNCPYWRE